MAAHPYQTCPAPTAPTQPSQKEAREETKRAGGCLMDSMQVNSQEPRGRSSNNILPGVSPSRAGQEARDGEETFTCSPHSHTGHRFLHPWNSPTQYLVCAKSCPTLHDPMDYSLPASSVHGTLQARILEWVAKPSSGDLPDPGIEPTSLVSPALAGGFFTTSGTLETSFNQS